MHKTSKDIAIRVLKTWDDGKALVEFYNMNSLKMNPKQKISSVYCGQGYIKMNPINEYEIIEV